MGVVDRVTRALPVDLGHDQGPLNRTGKSLETLASARDAINHAHVTQSYAPLPLPVESIEVDPVPEEQDADWAVNVGNQPTFLKLSELSSLAKATETVANVSEEGSNAVPCTVEAWADLPSRWGEHLAEPELQASNEPELLDDSIDHRRPEGLRIL